MRPFATVERASGIAVLSNGDVLVLSAPANGGAVLKRFSRDGQASSDTPLPGGSATEYAGARITIVGDIALIMTRQGRLLDVETSGPQLSVKARDQDFTQLTGTTQPSVPDLQKQATGQSDATASLTVTAPTFGDVALCLAHVQQGRQFFDVFATGVTGPTADSPRVAFIARLRIDRATQESTAKVVAMSSAPVPSSDSPSFGIAVSTAASAMSADTSGAMPPDTLFAVLPGAPEGASTSRAGIPTALVMMSAGYPEEGGDPPHFMGLPTGAPFLLATRGMVETPRGALAVSDASSTCADMSAGYVTLAAAMHPLQMVQDPKLNGLPLATCTPFTADVGTVEDAAVDATTGTLYFTSLGGSSVMRAPTGVGTATTMTSGSARLRTHTAQYGGECQQLVWDSGLGNYWCVLSYLSTWDVTGGGSVGFGNGIVDQMWVFPAYGDATYWGYPSTCVGWLSNNNMWWYLNVGTLACHY